MYMINKITLNIILFFLLMNFSIEGYDWYYKKNKKIFCADKEEGCTFTISSNNPISPKIPTSILEHALIMGDYKYIYLIFYPEGQIKRFYLMAYDNSNKETIISNGDIYDIDCSEKNKYEIQIFKPLKTNSLIQFLFLGLPENFYMEVEIRFKLNPILYLDDIKLNDENSLKSSDNENILKYLDEMDRKSNAQIKRIIAAKQIFSKIAKNLFDTTIYLSGYEFTWSEIIMAPPCLIVTISYEVGLEISTEKFFETENNILSETKIIKGKIDSHYDGLDLLDGNVNIDNNLLKYFDLYNKNIQEIILSFGLETESCSITVSTNALLNCIIYTLRFFNDNESGTILYEIEIKIEINNNMLAQLAITPKSIYSFNWPILNENKKILITGVIYALIITSAILTNGATVGLLTLPI